MMACLTLKIISEVQLKKKVLHICFIFYEYKRPIYESCSSSSNHDLGRLVNVANFCKQAISETSINLYMQELQVVLPTNAPKL